MSLILVVARAEPADRPDPGPADHDLWAHVLARETGDGDVMTVDYAADATDAVAAAERAIVAGNRHIALVPVAGVDATGGDTDVGSAELARLEHLRGTLEKRYPTADIVIATSRSGSSPSFVEVLGALHPADADDPNLLAAAVARAFDGDLDRFGAFVRALQQGVPTGTQLALRGSVIQGYSYKTLEPFDAAGVGSSDIDVVLFGDEAMAAWDQDAFFIRGVNTLPLGDQSRWVAPSIDPARDTAQRIAGRPVNIQAMARWFMDIRSGLQGQPYVLLDA